MVSFFEVITFFGVAAFFAWLEFVVLLNDLASQFDHTDPAASMRSPLLLSLARREARRNLVGISDHFLVSFVFFATAVGANYLYHNAVWIGPYFFGSLFHSSLLYVIFVTLFPTGIITFCVPIWYIRGILRADRDLVTKPLNVSGTLGLFYFIAMMVSVDWLGYTSTQFQYGTEVAVIAGVLTIIGVVRTLKKQRFGEILILTPLWLWIFLSLLLNFTRWLSNLN